MTKIKLTINEKPVEIASGKTILDAARKLNINIPTLCHHDKLKPFTSCMVCVVEDTATGRLIPACSTPAQHGQVLLCDTDKVHSHRKTALELLLSEHVGDCEGPCQRICAAGMDIPWMMQEIERDRWDKAIEIIKTHIPLPAVLGRICPAPCEKGCRRGQVDTSLGICLLKMTIADWDLEKDTPYTPSMAAPTGKKVIIVGSGPAGLSAAYYLLAQGHDVGIIDAHDSVGGELRIAVPELRLPRTVLDAEIALILQMGCKVQINTRLGEGVSLKILKQKYDAIIMATGSQGEIPIEGLEHTSHGIKVDSSTLATSMPGVYAAGAAIRHHKMAVRSVGQGRQAALSVHKFLTGTDFGPRAWQLNSRVGKLTETEIEMYKSEYACPTVTDSKSISHESALAEALRCLHCECATPNTCELRNLSESYNASTRAYPGDSRATIYRSMDHSDIIYEQGKCIKCGICVRLTEAEKEPLGLTFIGRGFDVIIGAPLNRDLNQALKNAAKKAAKACPTGALCLKTEQKGTLL
ncbi:(2Fe-2S)-binding protein [bacterium]|nr:(2Fe-2S)-binding protein [bacterium]